MKCIIPVPRKSNDAKMFLLDELAVLYQWSRESGFFLINVPFRQTIRSVYRWKNHRFALLIQG